MFIQTYDLVEKLQWDKTHNDKVLDTLTLLKKLVWRYGVLLQNSVIRPLLEEHNISQMYDFLSEKKRISLSSLQTLINAFKEKSEYTTRFTVQAPIAYEKSFVSQLPAHSKASVTQAEGIRISGENTYYSRGIDQDVHTLLS